MTPHYAPQTADSFSTLEPEAWPDLRAACDAITQASIEFLASRRDQPVWQPPTGEAIQRFDQPLPRGGAPLDELVETLVAHVLPYSVGNTHPRFMGWVHGSGTPASIVPEILKATLNVNAGGRNHIAAHVEKQVIEWSRDLLGFPRGTSGVLTTGTSVANLVCLKVARNRALGPKARELGLQAIDQPLTMYTSTEAHSSVAKAAEMLGLGTASIRAVPVDDQHRMIPDALARAIELDIAEGARPVAVIPTAGTVNIGAIDPLAEIADICADTGVWMHVDAAFGAAMLCSAELAPRFRGVERADSVAFDFHKWFHAPYSTGCALVRHAEEHLAAFGAEPAYLASHDEGLSAGRPWPSDLGPDLSRPFHALPVWFTLAHFGADKIGERVENNLRLATELARLVDDQPRLERLAPAPANIVCFRYVPERAMDDDRLSTLNADLVARVQVSGVAAPSTTRIDGRTVVRVNLTNHRTEDEDLRILLDAVLAHGAELAAG